MQRDASVAAASHNLLNQVTGLSATGPIRFVATVDEAADVRVNGIVASVDGANRFSADVTLSPGNRTVSITATDGSGNAATKSYQIVVGTGSGERTLVYDVNGNLLNDGAGRTCSWDALNRLASVTVGGNTTSFVYDGAGRRVLERLNGSEIRRWVYGSGPQPIEERNAANQVTKRFYAGLGEQIGNQKYFYTTDHLGSVREMTDWSGNICARYDYDPYGKVTKLSGDMESAFGFTGFYKHAATGLNLTLYRAYDAELSRWISRDPIGENGGINLYGYVANNPVNAVDPRGDIAFIPILIAIWGITEIALSVYDVYDTTVTLLDPCISGRDKLIAGLLLAAGTIAPGGGYSQADNVVKKVGKNVPEIQGPPTIDVRTNRTGTGEGIKLSLPRYFGQGDGVILV